MVFGCCSCSSLGPALIEDLASTWLEAVEAQEYGWDMDGTVEGAFPFCWLSVTYFVD